MLCTLKLLFLLLNSPYYLPLSGNHSCVPNAETTFPENNFLLHVTALEDIKPGEVKGLGTGGWGWGGGSWPCRFSPKDSQGPQFRPFS